jgi:hypothetical protein
MVTYDPQIAALADRRYSPGTTPPGRGIRKPKLYGIKKREKRTNNLKKPKTV